MSQAPALDKDGFLRHRADWSPAWAQATAAAEQLQLGDQHWQILELARDFYARTGLAPEMRPLVKLVRDALGPELGNSIALLQLFPGNPAKTVARLAGLPKPLNCL